MKLFISWSGERSKALAFALRDWFPLVLHYVEPWLSEVDIEAGQRWAEAVAKELEASNFGIVCITKDNLNSPWVLFESGALAKSLQDSRVIPLLLDLDFREISGPLAQFQAKKIDKAGLLETVQSVNQFAANAVPEDRYKQLFEALWPEFERKVAAIPNSAMPHKQTRPQTEVLEELVSTVRTMEARYRDFNDDPRSPQRMRMHPLMLCDLGRMIGERSGDPVSLLVTASMFRDDAPWLYELGMEAYRQASSGDRDAARIAMKRFVRGTEIGRRGPFMMDDFGMDPKMLHMLVSELSSQLELDDLPPDAINLPTRRKKSDIP